MQNGGQKIIAPRFLLSERYFLNVSDFNALSAH